MAFRLSRSDHGDPERKGPAEAQRGVEQGLFVVDQAAFLAAHQ
jgi:hypothetical protein